MARAPFQILAFPYRNANGNILYGLLKRSDDGNWQGIAGGGEDGESPTEAARREAQEEAGIQLSSPILHLQTISSIPVTHFRDSPKWGNQTYVIPEHCFGILVEHEQISISSEHSEFRWCTFEEAVGLLRYDGNKTALWELDRRVRCLGPRT